jgi:hypothetical protein
MLVVNLKGRKYGVIPGADGKYILTDDEFIHAVYESGESATLEVGFPEMETGRGYSFAELDELQEWGEYTLGQLLALAVETRLGNHDDEFGAYWGIKERIEYNYHLLRESVIEIGGDVSALPKWGAK